MPDELKKTMLNYIGGNEKATARFHIVQRWIIITLIASIIAMGVYAYIIINYLRQPPGVENRMKLLLNNHLIAQRQNDTIINMLKRQDSIFNVKNKKK